MRQLKLPILRMWQCVVITIVSSIVIAFEFGSIESPVIWQGNATVVEVVREDPGIGIRMTNNDKSVKFKANGIAIETDWLKNQRKTYWCKVRLNGGSTCAVPHDVSN